MALHELVRQDRTSLQKQKDLLSAEIQRHVDEYLARGKSITEIPHGVSGEWSGDYFRAMASAKWAEGRGALS